jgi:hypothetical protein
MRFSFCKNFGRKVRFLLVTIIVFLFTAVLILPMLGGIASITGIGKPLLFVSFFFLAAALVMLFITVRRVRKASRKVAPALFRYWLVLLMLSIGVNLIFNLVEDINLNAAKRELRVAGIPLTLKEIIPPFIPSAKNSAPIFQKAFNLNEELWKKYQNEELKSFPYGSATPVQDLTAVQLSTASKLVFGNPDFQNLYKLIDQAVSFPSCRFDLAYENGPETLLPHLSPLRHLARLNSARTYLLVEKGRYREALESARVGLRIGDCLKSEPILISNLVGIAIDVIGMKALNDLFNRAPGLCSAKDCQVLIQELDGKKIELGTVMNSEVVLSGCFLFNRILKGYFPPIFSLELTRPHEKGLFRCTAWITNPFSKKEFAFYLRTMKQIIKKVDKPYYQVNAIYARLGKEIFDNRYHCPIAGQILWSFVTGYTDTDKNVGIHNPMMRNAENLNRLYGFKIALALRIYKTKTGRYPDNLSALVPDILPVLPFDQFTGKDFIYRKKGAGVIVYSIGQNLVDDNGRQDFKTKPVSDDIAWEVK